MFQKRKVQTSDSLIGGLQPLRSRFGQLESASTKRNPAQESARTPLRQRPALSSIDRSRSRSRRYPPEGALAKLEGSRRKALARIETAHASVSSSATQSQSWKSPRTEAPED